MADIVLRGGEIINGEGHPAVSGDVVVDGGTIVSVSYTHLRAHET